MIIQEQLKLHYPNWQHIPDHLYRTLIAGSSGTAKNKYIT